MALPPGLQESLPQELLELLPENWETELPTEQLRLIDQATKDLEARLYHSTSAGDSEYSKYWGNPTKFIEEILGRTKTPDQKKLHEAIAQGDTRIVAKGANSTGKTEDIASIIIYYKLCAPGGSIVITTAPSEAQVKNQIWQEMRKQIADANKRGAGIDTRGMKPSDPEWSLGPLNYARGIATNHPERFKGDHHRNMLVVIDEGPGVPKYVMDGAEQMASAKGNIILLSGNPTNPTGLFFDAFGAKSPWTQITLSALDHPNVTSGRTMIPGAVSREAVERDIAMHCMPLNDDDEHDPLDFEYPRNSGQWYRPDNIFLCRRMGEFPREGEETLIPVYLIEAAKENRQAIDTATPVDIGVDIARKGGDYTVCYARRGQSVLKRIRWKGYDTEESSRKIAALCTSYVRDAVPVGTIAVDAIGMGVGTADRLVHMREEGHIHCDRVLCVQVSEKGLNRDTYSTQRAELAFGLAERFKSGQIDLSRLGSDVGDFEADVAAIQITPDSRGKLNYTEKEVMRKLIGHSPDDFDAMCLAFIDTVDTFADNFSHVMSAGLK
jgi:phage terminase large subunit